MKISFKDFMNITASGAVRACIAQGAVKSGAAILGLSYSLPFSAAVITGALDLPLLILTPLKLRLDKVQNEKLWLALTMASISLISTGMLYGASLLGFLGTTSIANIVAFSILSVATLLIAVLNLPLPLPAASSN